MRDPKRIDLVLAVLKRYWKANPDLRLGQIIGNCAGDNVYNVEDDVVTEYLNERLAARRFFEGK